MLKGAASLFEGIEEVPRTDRRAKGLHDGRGGAYNTGTRGWCGSRQALLLPKAQEPATLVAFSVSPFESGQQQGTEHTGTFADDRELAFQLAASCSPLQQPLKPDAVLLQACYQSGSQTPCCRPSSNGSSAVHMPLPCSTPCWLALYKVGNCLQLYGIEEHEQGQQPAPHLLVEFQHDSFSSLQPQQCWLMRGPVTILQPQQEQLILLAPAAATTAPGPAAATSKTSHSTGPAGTPHVVTQLELDLSSDHILDCLDLEVVQQLMGDRSSQAAAVPVLPLNAASHIPSRPMTAAQPWKLSHCYAAAGGIQLLLGMQVAAAAHGVWDSQHPHQHQQQQQQEQEKAQLGLLVWLEVEIERGAATAVAGAAAAATSNEISPSMQVLCCWSTGWQEAAACAAMLHDKQQQQLVAIGSSTGALQMLSLQQTAEHVTLQQQQQACMPRFTFGQRSNAPLLQACGNVSGSPDSIHLLQQVVAAGAVHTNVVAVLHSTGSSNNSSLSTAPNCVTLLVKQGDQLQAVAQIPDAAAVLVPNDMSPLGLLCPWQQQEQQQQQQPHQSVAADSSALQLAAVILLDKQAVNASERQVTSLHCYAKLEASVGSGATPAVPSAVGFLRQMPPVLLQHQHGEVTAGQQQGAAKNAAQVADSNELRAVQTMLAVLEARWQQELLDLAALQQKLTQGRKVAAAAHKQLCQLAADTIQYSTVRQFSTPLNQIDTSTALKAYQMGQSILQQQALSHQQQHDSHGGLMDCRLQLTLEIVDCSSQLLAGKLQLIVCLKPILRLQQQEGTVNAVPNSSIRNSTTRAGPSSFSSWWGPLLQLCHAEVLMWHADVSPLTSQSSWHWDAVTSVITVKVEVPAAALLQIASASNAGTAGEHTPLRTVEQDSANGDADVYVGVARSVAATVTATLNPPVVTEDAAGIVRHISNSNSRCPAGSSGGNSDGPSVQLYAAVAVAACCSKQAAAHVHFGRLSSTGHVSSNDVVPADSRSRVEELVMLRSQLLTPATALLHLPAVSVSVEQLLLQQLAPAAPRTALQQHHQCGQQEHAAMMAHSESLRTPLKPKCIRQQQEEHQGQATPPDPGGPCSELQHMPTGFTNTDVIPPTPYDDGGGGYDGLAEHFPHELVVEDSQPEEEDAGHQLHHDHSMADLNQTQDRPAAGNAAATATDTAAAQQQDQLVVAGADATPQHTQLQQKMLFLKGPSAALQRVPFVLVQQFGFIIPTAGLPAGSAVDAAAVQQAQLQKLAAAFLGFGRDQKGLVHIKLQPHAVTASGGDSSINQDAVQLVWLSDTLLHVELVAGSRSKLGLLQQLLQLALKSIPQADSIKCELSPLSAHRHASCLAATDALTQTVYLHCKVIEETLQQIHHLQLQQKHAGDSVAAAAQSGPSNAGAARSVGAAGIKRGAAGVEGVPAAHLPDAVPGDAADGSALYVDGLRMSPALSDCWVALYQSQADADLAMSQLHLADE